MSGCSRAVRRCVASAEIAGSTPASRSMVLIQKCVFAGVAEREMYLIRNEDDAGSIPAASSKSKRGYMTSAMTMPVLVLNASYEPVNITRARRALVLLIKGVAVIEEAHDRYVHIGLQLPCVIRLRQYRRLPSRIQTLSRKNILIRDGYVCQYCGEQFVSGELELEHVIPRARGGLSTWENLVAACRDCNVRKADRTPAEAGMKLLRQPRRVTIHTSRALMRQTGIGEEKWRKYLYY
jgi:5-methylcytosine-specific restriction endonuclease McrA